MKLSPLKIFALKLALFSSMLAYMAIDLFLWQGPLWHAIYAVVPRQETLQQAVAVVHGERITQEQLARHTAEQNWLRGDSQEDPGPARRATRLMELVHGALLRMRARYNDKNLPDFATEAEAEVARLASRAKSDEEFELWLAGQGYTRRSFTQKLHAIKKETALLDRAVRPFCDVTDEDVAKHYEMLKNELRAPEQRPLKHIFFAKHKKDPTSVHAKAQEVLNRLLQNEADFATLARQYSEDERTAPLGGELGIVARDEHFPLPELPLFGEGALPAGQAALVQSRWGWHILLPGEITPARQLTLDETRESLRTAIRSAQYEIAVQNFLDRAVRESFHHKHLQIHHAH